ncbi:MAG: ATP-binding cassette domain-containing protein [Acidimicrobiales bacterium]
MVETSRLGAKRGALAVAAAVLAGATPVGVALASGALLAAVVGIAGHHHTTLGHMYLLVGVVAVLMLASQAALGLRTQLGDSLGRRVSGALIGRALAAAAVPVTVDWLDEPAVASRLARVRGLGSIEVLPGDAVAGLINKVSVWSGNLAAAGLLAAIRWWLGLGTILVLGGSYVAIRRGYSAIVIGSQDESGALRRAAYLRDVLITGPAAKEVRLFGLTDYFVDSFRTTWDQTMRHLRSARANDEWVSYVLCLGVGLTYVVVLGVLGLGVARRHLSTAQLAAGALALAPLTNGILPGRDDLNIGWGAVSARAAADLEDQVGPLVAREAVLVPGSGPVRLACRDLGFAYPSGQVVFRSLDLELEPGQSLAIVGENGSGKTTLAALLAGLLAPMAGQVWVDGVELAEANRRSWQTQVAVLFQDFVHYDASVYDNVAFGAPDHLEDRDGIDRAAAGAGLAPVVEQMPQGWASLLGTSQAGGGDLSGGQWQRVGLARALFALAHGARLLILDEPAASLDVAAETELYDRFLELTRGVTSIIVSHRLAAVRHADRIIVLEAGAVVEDGTHDRLIEAGGRYAEMFELQARRFAEGQA